MSNSPLALSYQSDTDFDDIWARAEGLNLCAFCACELNDPLPSRCPQCHRKLYVSHFEYEKPSANFHIYWVLVIALSQLFLVQVLLSALEDIPPEQMWLQFLLIPTYFFVGILVALRQQWAFYLSLVVLALTIILLGLMPFVYAPLAAFLSIGFADTPVAGLAEGFARTSYMLIRALQVLGAVLALLFGLFVVMADFNRRKVWLLARLDRKLTSAGGLHLAATKAVNQGMWATAVLQWRKAIVLDPRRLLYHLHLAEAFAHLKFYERSLDVLQSAEKIVQSDQAKTKIRAMVVNIQAQKRQHQTQTH
ncbi:MAG: hypothetical protein KDD89_00160 [Anaerolineales bacterium]|nr:hypothetical protein [Anaerolineales bacterium]